MKAVRQYEGCLALLLLYSQSTTVCCEVFFSAINSSYYSIIIAFNRYNTYTYSNCNFLIDIIHIHIVTVTF